MMRGFVQRHPNLSASLFGILLVAVLAAGVEGVFWILLQQRLDANPPFTRAMDGLSEDHPLLGYRPIAGMAMDARKDRPGEVAYACRYTIDTANRRVTPVSATAGRDRFALFFGGSFTFGEGVEDNETLPAQFGRHATGYRPYNYGYVGYGPQNLYMHLQRPELAEEITESSGVAVFTYIDDHMKRAVGAMRTTTGWGRRLPYLQLEPDGLRFHGTFEQGRPGLQRFYELLSWSPALRYLRVDTPRCDAPKDYDLVTAIFRASHARLQVLFPDAELYVLMYPHMQSAAALIPRLEAAGVRVLDYTRAFDDPAVQSLPLFLADGHPAPAAYRVLGARLAQDLDGR